MVRFRYGAGSGAVIGAAVGYAVARSVDPQYDQAVMLLGVMTACCFAFGPEVWSFVRDRLAACG
jgi:uncharacterized membrane protein (Fun14 family)